jgi:hypothetical protein
VGPLKLRSSKTARSSYVSNGCRKCDALIGSRPLEQELLAAEKPFDRYPTIELSLPKPRSTA